MVLYAKQFLRVDPKTGKSDPDGSCFVAKISGLEIPKFIKRPHSFIIKDCPMPGMLRGFHYVGYDGNDDDIYGWRYEEDDGPNKGRRLYTLCDPFTVLIIND